MTDSGPPLPPRPNLLRRLYAWTAAWAERPTCSAALFLIAVAEASFFPIPPDVLLIAILGANPRRWLVMATVCTAGSVLGGALGYWIGLSMRPAGDWLLAIFASPDVIERVKQSYQEHAFMAVLGAAFTPIPYKVFTITAGYSEIHFWIFMAASILGRGGRFFLVAVVFRFVGPAAKPFIERRLEWLTLALFALAVCGVLAVKLV